jgi:cytosine/creatinine deaminase
VLVDLAIRDGRIAALHPAGQGSAACGAGLIEQDGGEVWPGLIDVHTHLDKGHIWPRAENPDGTFEAAVEAVRADRAKWSADDVRRRFHFGLRCAYAHGTVAIRTHLDSPPEQCRISWAVFRELRAEWEGRITLQATSLVTLDDLRGPFAADLADLVAESGGVLGAVTAMSPTIDADLDRVFALAAERGLDLDFHVDESLDPGAHSLRHIAETALRRRFQGSVLCGHCCSLAVQEAAAAERTLDLVREAGIALVSLPMCNLYLQDRVPGRTPRRRGVTLLHEMAARGIPVALASDNCRDPFFAYGDHDMLEVLREAVRIAHLDRPLGAWPKAITRTPADVMALPDTGVIRVGAPADLVLFRARSDTELLSRPQSDRIVLRAGREIDTTPPDYREFDQALAGSAG